MSYHDWVELDGHTGASITCEARKGRGICQNRAEIVVPGTRKDVQHFFYLMGWRILRGHQVCSECLKNKRVVFPRQRRSKA